MMPLTLRTARKPGRPARYQRETSITLAGNDWSVTVWYDATRHQDEWCPGLEVDLVQIDVREFHGADDTVQLPPGVYFVPWELPPELQHRLTEDCAEDWTACHSPEARRAEEDENYRDRDR